MRTGTVAVDLPRYMAWHIPTWLMRTNLAIWLMVIVPCFMGYWPAFLLWMIWVGFNFAWVYRMWRAAGRPVIDDKPTLGTWLGALKSDRRKD